MKKIFSLLLVIFIGLVTFVALGPFLTLNGIEDSFQNEETEALSKYVNFPALRENIKSQLSARLAKKPTGNSWRDMAASWGTALAAKMVDGLVTEAGLELLLSGQGLLTSDEPNLEDSDAHSALKNAEFSYHSHDTFYVYISMQNGKKVQATLTREGLTWKLTNVALNH